MKTIDLRNWEENMITLMRFKAYLNGNGNVADYLRSLIVNDPMKMRSPKKQYCFTCHSENTFIPASIMDVFTVTIDGTRYDLTVTDFPMDRCVQCGTVYESVSLGAAFEEVLMNLISRKKAEGSPIPTEISLVEWLYDIRTRTDIEEDLITFKKSELAKLILSYGEKMDVAETKSDQISTLAKMELLNHLIRSGGSDLNDD